MIMKGLAEIEPILKGNGNMAIYTDQLLLKTVMQIMQIFVTC